MRALKVMLSVVATNEEQVAFIEYVSSDISNEDVIDHLLKEYDRQCGISLGNRAAIWDSVMAVYSYFSPKFAHDGMTYQVYLRAHMYLSSKRVHFDQNDVAMLNPLESMSYQMKLFINADRENKQALAVGLFCFAIVNDDWEEYFEI